MKKSIVLASTILVTMSLAACSNQSSSSENTSSSSVKVTKKATSKSSSSSSKTQTDRFNNNEYGIMGYLMLVQRSATELANAPKNSNAESGMEIKKNGNVYTLGMLPIGHSVNVIVNNDNVTVKYDENTDGSGMGDKNGSKTYSKQELTSKYASQKDEIDKVIKKYNLDSNSGTNNSNQQAAPTDLDEKTEAVLIYAKANGFDTLDVSDNNTASMELSTTDNGRKTIGYGSDGDVQYQIDGNNVTYWTLDHSDDTPAYKQKMIEHTTTLSELKQEFYTPENHHQLTVDIIADNMEEN
ncbi:Lreu_0056 family protein [Limosilactobacillus reuteri]|uniref:Lreu_0056 family protein n=1 Tax=Limosilactobacillus reuteri TaxID=1598 RepID=UPI003D76CE16